MRTLNISISDLEFNKFGLKEEQLSFSELIELVSKELMRQNLDKCVALADRHELSKMSIEEITNEVKAVRQNAKNRH
jgi:predicted CopG family antitoxin